ncbi:MAG: futalosine hydrolase [Salinivirgaceae bacterium]|nr:futalosine hydrolase [Salinivirgaceae bacterium]MDD4745978.1 futalosine hydrolase [Salinivirgaceae bacterium]MDY0280665.1 futalosine hydrolase [Salinivirgaceae bacterium]
MKKENTKQRILIVVATAMEVQLIVEHRNSYVVGEVYPSKYEHTDILIAGIGIATTIFSTTKILLKHSYDYVINIGICGAYARNLSLGEVVIVREDFFADQLMEDGFQSTPWSKSSLAVQNDIYNSEGSILSTLTPDFLNLSKVRSITSDTIHANESTIKKLVDIYNPDIESMEGVAVFFVTRKCEIPVIQIRAISNYVEIRDKSKWEIGKALIELHRVLDFVMQNKSSVFDSKPTKRCS